MTPRVRQSFTVMVVDDDPSVLATYRRLLRRLGYHTLAESCPLTVLRNLSDGTTDHIDLLLMDYKMPGMDGLTLLAELRRRECHAHCILVSAFLNDDVRHQASNLGVARVLEKPVGVDTLRQALDELLPLVSSVGVAG